MRQHADDALPGLLLLLAQRAAQVGEDQQLVRPAFAAEVDRRSSSRPLSGPNGRSSSRGVSPIEVRVQPQFARHHGRADPRAGFPSRRSAGRIDEHQLLVHVEREDRDVDRRHDAREQRGRLDRLGSLALQRVAERVDLVITRSTAPPGSRPGRRGSSSPPRAARRAGWPEKQHALTIWQASAAQPIQMNRTKTVTSSGLRRSTAGSRHPAAARGPPAGRRATPAQDDCHARCASSASLRGPAAYSRTPYCCSRRYKALRLMPSCWAASRTSPLCRASTFSMNTPLRLLER